MPGAEVDTVEIVNIHASAEAARHQSFAVGRVTPHAHQCLDLRESGSQAAALSLPGDLGPPVCTCQWLVLIAGVQAAAGTPGPPEEPQEPTSVSALFS